MNTVTFGDYNSYDDLSLWLNSKSIGAPEVKTETVEVAGSDVLLDFTEFSGEPRYKPRTLTFNFTSALPYAEHTDQRSELYNKLNGRKMHIVLSEDTDYYYVGRLSVGEFADSKRIGTVTVTATCEPYKYKASKTNVEQAISSSGTVKLTNDRKTVCPTIRTTAEMTIKFGSTSAALSANTDYVLPELLLKEGTTSITVTGTGTITFTYQEATL